MIEELRLGSCSQAVVCSSVVSTSVRREDRRDVLVDPRMERAHVFSVPVVDCRHRESE